MASPLTPRERVERAVRFEVVDHVPFTIYECMIPQCAAERTMRNEGLCIVQRGPNVFSVYRPHVTGRESHSYAENGRPRTRQVIHTDAGDLTSVDQPAGFTHWHLEHPFKRPEDYAPLIAYHSDVEVVLSPGAFLRMSEMKGGDAVMRGAIGLEPLQLIIHHYMGVETFAVEWMERRDDLLRLFDAIVDERRRTYPVLAESPCEHFNYGGGQYPGFENCPAALEAPDATTIGTPQQYDFWHPSTGGPNEYRPANVTPDGLGIETVERSIDRSELYVADEAFFTGTATNVAPITSIDHRNIGTGDTGPLTAKLQELFNQVALGRNPKYSEWYTFLKYE